MTAQMSQSAHNERTQARPGATVIPSAGMDALLWAELCGRWLQRAVTKEPFVCVSNLSRS
jgi:hypothetical protein